jgi:hypothetical protein
MIMSHTGFWMIRHALVEENARHDEARWTWRFVPTAWRRRARPCCAGTGAALPGRLGGFPLVRTRRTAEAIFHAGYPKPDGRSNPI